MSTSQPLTLHAADGYPLAACLYPAQGPVQANLLVASATGVPQQFYRRFAEFAASQGMQVLTFDYRGIGGSRPADLATADISYVDWGELDLAAAVAHFADADAPLYVVGHSFGGHALGMLPAPQQVTAAYVVGCGAGWAGWMPRLEGLKVRLMWNLVLPLLVRRTGYLAWSRFGMGEDLPKGVYQQWKRWCRWPHYLFDDPQQSALHQRYAAVRIPMLFANALDDDWALPRSRDAFISGYRNAPCQTRDLTLERGALGHMGYFRPGAQWLWQEMLDTLPQLAPR
ncbi:alpha/beta hydrolase family protein [Isoalcanivorax beigongshangi]|uniref:Alpha/beta fold hydrolase n=1 Tax=Isoalcanivorax beigongshangi TaxID=3238810 RepID=A0ABV4AEA9_9GAMM